MRKQNWLEQFLQNAWRALNFKKVTIIDQNRRYRAGSVDEAKVNLEVAAVKRVSAQSNLKIAQEQLGYTRLVAPSDGVVTGLT